MKTQKIVYATLRIVMGFIFLWAFFDKTFGLGFATTADKAWINGGSPTYGFLAFATKGPFVDIFHNLAMISATDWVFMIGLLFIGLTLVFNKFVKWGALAGGLMMLLMYLALLLPENNPIIDEHLVYILVLAVLYFKDKERKLMLS